MKALTIVLWTALNIIVFSYTWHVYGWGAIPPTVGMLASGGVGALNALFCILCLGGK